MDQICSPAETSAEATAAYRRQKKLELGTGDGANGFVVVIQAGGQIFGAIVDNVFHTHTEEILSLIHI